MPLTPDSVAPLNGLVLVGGKSLRMGSDKSRIAYHGIPEWKRVYDLLKTELDEVFVSVASTNQQEFQDVPCILDHWDAIGPMGGIASALKSYPDHAWLVLACDMPAITEKEIRTLVASRDANADATVCVDSKGKREPLCSIYEPSILKRLCDAIQSGDYSVNRCLDSATLSCLTISDDDALRNLNTPQESESFRANRVHFEQESS